MSATLAPAPPRQRRGARARIAGLERTLLAGGLALLTIHLLDLAISGPRTWLLAVIGIVALPLVWWLVQPHVTRPTRIGLGLVVGLVSAGFGIASHGLHVVNSGPDRYDITGLGLIVGGLLLVASGLAAIAAPRRPPRRPGAGWRAAHGAGWVLGAAILTLYVLMPFAGGMMTTHAPRWEIQEASLGIPHEEVRIDASGGRELSAWYIPTRNGATLLVGHGSGGSRERVLEEIRMLARHGYGVLAFDLFGNGESSGHSNGLGDNAQPAVDAALDWLASRPGVDPDRIGAFGSSLGGEVLLEATARDPRLRAVVSDGAKRPEDDHSIDERPLNERIQAALMLHATRAIGGTRAAPSLDGIVPRIAPRPVLLIASGGDPEEIPVNRRYRVAAGASAERYEIPDANHTAGITAHPREYEQRVIAFLDRAL